MSKPAITVAALLLLGVPTCAGYERELTKIRPEKEGKFEKIMDPADLLRTAGIEIQATSGSKSGSSSSGKSSGSKSGTGKSSKSSGSTGKSSKSSGSTGKSSKSSGSTGKSSKGSKSTGKSSKGSKSTGKSSKGSKSTGKSSKGGKSTGKSSKGSKSTGKSASERGTSSPSLSPSPTESPTASPTKSPTASPSTSPTISPTATPVASDFPSAVPSVSVAPTIPCNMDEEMRRQMIFNILTVDNDVTPAAEINDVGSSANLAFEWLVGEDALYLCPDEPKIIQRYVLAKIYFQSNGDDWLQCSRPGNVCAPGSSDFGPLGGEDWLSPVNECDWAFLRCNNDNCITHIEVDENLVTGTLVEEIDWLEFIMVYTMDGDPNELTGTIPTQFGNLPNLILLDLDENALTGTIPEEIFSATSLQQLDLDTNQLTGTISTLLGSLLQLNFLQLFGNPISGTFPNAELENLTLLTTIGLDKMDLTGEVSEAVCDLPNLQNFWTDCNPIGNNPPQVVCDCCTFCSSG